MLISVFWSSCKSGVSFIFSIICNMSLNILGFSLTQIMEYLLDFIYPFTASKAGIKGAFTLATGKRSLCACACVCIWELSSAFLGKRSHTRFKSTKVPFPRENLLSPTSYMHTRASSCGLWLVSIVTLWHTRTSSYDNAIETSVQSPEYYLRTFEERI